MYLFIECPVCEGNGQIAGKLSCVEFVYDGREVYNLTCCLGHTFKLQTQTAHFDFLFDAGCNAIIDGYYREAVSSFSSSLERFMEFFAGSY